MGGDRDEGGHGVPEAVSRVERDYQGAHRRQRDSQRAHQLAEDGTDPPRIRINVGGREGSQVREPSHGS